jgi:methionine synthase II (cobalamin-independent)
LKKQHAEHNEKVCDYLLKSSNFHDWVITTAFYSALHHVQHEIFPLVESGKTYNSINQYYQRSKTKISKHDLTITLVKKIIPSAYPYYKWLYDACMTARYINYKTPESFTKQAKLSLQEIKKTLKKR